MTEQTVDPMQVQAQCTGFLNKTATVDGTAYPYVLYVPRHYTSERQWSVILFLHGSGESGSDGLKQTQGGIGTALRTHPERYPALVVMPQCVSKPNDWAGNMITFALTALDQTLAEYNIDADRQYLTGLSMGGFGSWRIAAQVPDRFAAVVPICGGGDPKAMAEKLTRLPIWVFHGENDEVVRPGLSRDMVEAITEAGSKTIRFTQLHGIGHNSWDPAYNSREFTDWLFMQRKGQRRG